jgi:hypothetical protein
MIYIKSSTSDYKLQIVRDICMIELDLFLILRWIKKLFEIIQIYFGLIIDYQLVQIQILKCRSVKKNWKQTLICIIIVVYLSD